VSRWGGDQHCKHRFHVENGPRSSGAPVEWTPQADCLVPVALFPPGGNANRWSLLFAIAVVNLVAEGVHPKAPSCEQEQGKREGGLNLNPVDAPCLLVYGSAKVMLYSEGALPYGYENVRMYNMSIFGLTSFPLGGICRRPAERVLVCCAPAGR